jgi:RNA polymerase sigma-70 factor (ECF subfamily)
MEPIQLDDEAIEIVETTVGAAAVELLETPAPEQLDAIKARHLEERGYAEIAAELRCSESVIRKRVSRGLTELKGSDRSRTRVPALVFPQCSRGGRVLRIAREPTPIAASYSAPAVTEPRLVRSAARSGTAMATDARKAAVSGTPSHSQAGTVGMTLPVWP